MTERDENGKFVKGSSGNPRGRMPKEREEKFYEITMNACTYKDWEAITRKAVEQAKRGDAVARKWLADYLIGAPVQRTEVSGKDGNELTIRFVNDWRNPDERNG